MKSSEVSRAADGAELLRRVRDEKPTQEQVLEWLGEAGAGRFHILRKAGLLRVEQGVVFLAPEHLDGSGCVVWIGRSSFIRWNLNTGEVQIGRAGHHP